MYDKYVDVEVDAAGEKKETVRDDVLLVSVVASLPTVPVAVLVHTTTALAAS